ncbi:LLM class flavin-dependent oxidoreductase [Alkalilimnicola sp. S0819]|uniref:LLM class flavin-dependent oxidoreductase n=1 Tax=Alkalilimnicola sp. S0819 TaxID=2613922 RepID=UPI00126261F2|nr:LLM class flavin-dependent oxidoreductase [Alkalilimnicola sp. S0819]KAB7619640.1 LLM class flavin-dependent oxidoreductase [Alkalilimnicola sp. S0819]MPQ17578.1 MsnO8 family LLM class oxidoreductase [Alkalilimnicola sp. S0819]
MTAYSVLDLAPIRAGGDAAEALHHSRELARLAERCGYTRYWLAEHHNMTGIASAATAVVIGHIAGGTERIRVGAGGIMLPNHAPLVVAEQFGTLESLYPGRIDLGLGRAPGTDQRTARALRRYFEAAEQFPQDLAELQGYFQQAKPGQAVQAVPGAGLRVPIWLLGSSLFSAQLAALRGLPFAFASHFAPDQLLDALHVYRSTFRASADLQAPYSMAGVNVFVADTDEQAQRLYSSLQQQFLALRRGRPGKLPPPVEDITRQASPQELAMLERTLGPGSVVGSPETVRAGLGRFIERTRVQELMITAQIHDHQARCRSFELAAEIMREL